MKFYRNFQTNCYPFVKQGKKTLFSIVTYYWSLLFDTFLYFEEEAPVCVACNAVITVNHILIECADFVEIGKKYFEERSLYSLFRNVIPEFFILFSAIDWCVL